MIPTKIFIFTLVFLCGARVFPVHASNTNVTVDSAGLEPFDLPKKDQDNEQIVFYKDGDWTVDFKDSSVGPRLNF
jgi:hypothetical protein